MTADVEAGRSCWANLKNSTTQASVPGWNFHPWKMWWWFPIKQCSKPPLVDDYRGLYYIILTKSNQYMEDHRDLLGEPQARFQPEKKKHCQRDQVASITIGKMRKCYEKKCGIIVKRGDTVIRMQPYATYKSKNYVLINTLKSTYKNRESTQIWVQFCIYSIIQTWKLKSTMDSWFYS